jgi:tRNA pseudouridine55 synthase
MNGILNTLKPADMTSQQVVATIRRLLSIKKAGHGGTLDPAAAGVLPVFLGDATRLAEFVAADEKEYIAEIRFGFATDTQDAQGRVVSQTDVRVEADTVRTLIEALPESLWQTPPAYSAIKIGGQKLVDLARKGLAPPMPPRHVRLLEKQYLGQTGDNAFLMRVRCSKGTYIRTLCHDLGTASGAGAHLGFLLRTQSGRFRIEDAVTLETIAQAAQSGLTDTIILPMDIAVAHLCRIDLAAGDARRVGFGQALLAPEPLCEGQRCSFYHEGTLIGIGSVNDGAIKPDKVFLSAISSLLD